MPVRIDNADFDLVDGVVVLEGVDVAAAPDAVEPMDAALEPPPVDAATALLHFDRVSAHLSWDDVRNGGGSTITTFGALSTALRPPSGRRPVAHPA